MQKNFFLALSLVGLFFSVSEAAVSDAQKKAMSTFLSNFTALNFVNFDANDFSNPEDPADAINFGIEHNYRNNFKSRIVPCKNKKCPHGSLTIDAKFVTESIEEYFGFKFKAHKTLDDYVPPCFYDGKLYHFKGADHYAYARVENAELADGIWTATGELLNTDDESDILGKFTAKFKPHKWRGKDTYSILSIETEYTNQEIVDFLLHFTQYLSATDTFSREDVNNKWLINFGVWENYNFDAEKTRVLENGVVTVEAKYVAEAVKKYFNLDVKHQSIEKIIYDEKKEIYTFDANDAVRPGVRVDTVEEIKGSQIFVYGELFYPNDEPEALPFRAILEKHKYDGKDVYYLDNLGKDFHRINLKIQEKLRGGAALAEYHNERFGYYIEYPDFFDKREESDNGVWLKTKDGKYSLKISGELNVSEEKGGTLLAKRLKEISNIDPHSDRSSYDYYRVIYSDGEEQMFYEYGFVSSRNWVSFTFSYPKDESERFEQIADFMESSLTLMIPNQKINK